ncbi:peptide-methionine (S)-S-oxide reductase MsrA [Halomonas daqingensis]|uniref:Peptide methionine sulfoxide reductase MsrA n=1 Tax=Billgrantia desiderata TaxID=52021 RepID=A0AAW4YW75_9GAMM|nr:peptide-methionine (S)-S-oxide reductase MsrA [Halomonas desiderata]MCE8012292.1 peptide-methionine (S)-S-oxide reductase MsrA [Halomonas desiderata]MCE8028064.1 peptide-methionine (S)-S-oxide reductase MsrA [Halomonas desiderata]MCE8052380.1 peptide-methionine (S)-S-oxide reductase MsrA [Halomonas desiderata]SEG15834.1 peptide-methionine (S)-S-oxide reductase [Halomonas desiderata]
MIGIRSLALAGAVLLALPWAKGMASSETATAVFGGGCFWCVEEAFDKVEGVTATTSGFSGGNVENPSYQQVVAGNTGHAEVVLVEYDPAAVDYATLLHVFWRNIDPFAVDRQFCDVGEAYRSAIFYASDAERELAEATRDELAVRFERDIATEISPFEVFYPAEEYHQDYYRKNPVRYNYYKAACGRERRLEQVWGDEAGGLSQR